MKRQTKAAVLLIVAVLMLLCCTTGCSKKNKLVGSWQADYSSDDFYDFPEGTLILRADYSGIADGETITWAADDYNLTIVGFWIGETYSYVIKGKTLQLTYSDGDYAYYSKQR